MKKIILGEVIFILFFLTVVFISINYKIDVKLDFFDDYLSDVFNTSLSVFSTILGLFLVVLVYQFTVIKPNIFEEDLDTNKIKYLFYLTRFIYASSFISFVIFSFTIGNVLIIIICNGFNSFSFSLSVLGSIVTIFFIYLFQKKQIHLKKVWIVHKDFNYKVFVFNIIKIIIILNPLVFLTPYLDEYNNDIIFNSYSIYLAVNYLLVGINVYFLIQNQSLILVAGIDFIRFKKLIDKLNINGQKYLKNNRKNNIVEDILRKWDIIFIEKKFSDSDFDLKKLENDIQQIEFEIKNK